MDTSPVTLLIVGPLVVRPMSFKRELKREKGEGKIIDR